MYHRTLPLAEDTRPRIDFAVNALKKSSGVNAEAFLTRLRRLSPSVGKTAQGGETAVSQKDQISELKILEGQIRLNH
ncbi:MAG: hypothetical protein ACJA16_004117 [Akkermansiaceae bacterium]|jgi:hypothetical protein